MAFELEVRNKYKIAKPDRYTLARYTVSAQFCTADYCSVSILSQKND